MSNYTTLENGARGEEVKKLQKALESAGYSVGATGVDGIYGKNTQSAVLQYQQANGITGTGVADAATLEKLYGTPETTKSDAHKVAQERLEALRQQKPTAPAADTTLEELASQLKNYPEFHYDPGSDPLYESMRSRYVQSGRLAMLDATAQAANLTGGYGSTYGQQVGQQTYNAFLQELNAQLPTLHRQAYDAWNDGKEDLITQYGLRSDRDRETWERYQQELDEYYRDMEQLSREEEEQWHRKQEAASLAASLGDYSYLLELFELEAPTEATNGTGGPRYDLKVGRQQELENFVEDAIRMANALIAMGNVTNPYGTVYGMVAKGDYLSKDEKAYASAYLDERIASGALATGE